MSELTEDTIGVIQFEFADWRDRPRAHEIMDAIRAKTADIAGILIEVTAPRAGPATGKPIQVQIGALDPALLPAAAEKVSAIVGVAAYDAILETCRERARPVVLTAATAILGVLPIAFGMNIEFLSREITVGAPATQWWINLSTAIVFGLGFATVLTLIVTPAALMAIANLHESRRRWSAALGRRFPRLARA